MSKILVGLGTSSWGTPQDALCFLREMAGGTKVFRRLTEDELESLQLVKSYEPKYGLSPYTGLDVVLHGAVLGQTQYSTVARAEGAPEHLRREAQAVVDEYEDAAASAAAETKESQEAALATARRRRTRALVSPWGDWVDRPLPPVGEDPPPPEGWEWSSPPSWVRAVDRWDALARWIRGDGEGSTPPWAADGE